MPTILSVGDVLAGKYRVEKVLGVGGMGMVVAAMHLDLDERVALKTMLPDVATSPQHVERFLREAKAAVKLRSEHVCRVLDVGKLEDGAPYIVMEFMDGHDFAAVLKQRGALPVCDAVDYVLQAIEGIAEAHAARIVHRDLKPQNLFVTTDGGGSPLVKVLDFGISKSTIGGGSTKTGDIMGSPSYMAPEQMLSSKDVDGRADVWALGVILYQALSGQLPFEADTLPALCMRVMNEDPDPLNLLRTDLPPAVTDAVHRCLAKQPSERMPDVAALAAALAPFGGSDAHASASRVAKVLRRGGPAAIPTPVPGPTPLVISQPVAAVGALGATQASEARFHAPAGHISTLTAGSGAIAAQAPAPRGKRGLIAALAAGMAVIGAVAVIATRGSEHQAAPQIAPSAAPRTPSAASEAPSAAPAAPTPVVAPDPAPTPVPPVPTATASEPTAATTEPTAAASSTQPRAPATTAAKTSTLRKPASTKKATGAQPAAATPQPAYDPLSRRTREDN